MKKQYQLKITFSTKPEMFFEAEDDLSEDQLAEIGMEIMNDFLRKSPWWPKDIDPDNHEMWNTIDFPFAWEVEEASDLDIFLTKIFNQRDINGEVVPERRALAKEWLGHEPQSRS